MKIKIQLAEIPAGNITLRDDRLKQSWNVPVPAFRMAKFPVTQDIYYAVTGQNPSAFKGPRKPVESVSWEEAVQFCNLLSIQNGLSPYYVIQNGHILFDKSASGYRLPTEAEWQYACQAGHAQIRYGALDDIAWYRENAGSQTQDAGQKAPNAWGLYDMLGNVWEWCADLYDTEVYGTYRVFRGGGWADEARGCMATNRRRSHPTFKIDDLGFRIAQSINL